MTVEGAPDPTPATNRNGLTALLGLWVVALLGASAWVPHVPLAGPIGLDDLLPVAAIGLALIVALRLPPARPEPLLVLVIVSLLLGFAANLASGLAVDWVVLARGPGRTLFYLLLLVSVGGLTRAVSPRRMVTILVAAAIIEGLIGLALYAGDVSGIHGIGLHRPGRGSSLFWSSPGRLVATFNLPSGRGMNGLAAYFALFLPVTIALAATGRGFVRLTWLGGAAIQAVALWLTYTRSTLIALLAGAVVAISVWRRALVVPVMAAAGLALLFSPDLLGRFFSDSTDRLALVWAAVRLGAETPWLGHGDIHYNTFLWADSWRMLTPYGVAITTPHNSLALGFFRYGMVGTLVTGALLATPVVWFWRRAGGATGEARLFAMAGLCAFVAFGLQSMTNNLLEVPKIGLFFWLLWVVLRGASDD